MNQANQIAKPIAPKPVTTPTMSARIERRTRPIWGTSSAVWSAERDCPGSEVETLRPVERSVSGIGFGLLAIVLSNSSREW